MIKHSVQIIDNYSIHDLAKKQYPNLHKEVFGHDEVSKSSWYDLSEKAYVEFIKFRRMMYRKKLWEHA